MINVTEYRAAVLSDVHLCHERTSTKKIAEELMACFPDNNDTAKLNTIYIAGDWFDRLITYPNKDLEIAEDLMNYFLRLCLKHDIQLRILEGTPSHDWKQPKRFLHLNKSIGADLKYFDDLTIEHNDVYGIDVLYIPDEYDPDTDKTFFDVKKKMNELGLEKVDLAIMHGQFNYQLPEIAKVPKHNEDNYLNIVRYYILIGHVHVYSTYDRIIAQGSFSRLAHGEENPKGYVRINLYPNGNMNAKFIENKLATKYVTIDVGGYNIDDAFKKIKDITSKLPPGSYIRLKANKGDPILIEKNLDKLSLNEYGMIWTRTLINDTSKETVNNVRQISNIASVYSPITLTKENITIQLSNRLEDKGYESSDIELVKGYLKGIL